MKPLWKTAQAQAAILNICQDVREFFNVDLPIHYVPDYRKGADWEWLFDTVEVWTKAGRAELNVTINKQFAHMYFRFDDTERARQFDTAGRLNPFSGKWNAIGTPTDYRTTQDSLDVFRAGLRRDFRRVADPNPPADQVAAYRANAIAQAKES